MRIVNQSRAHSAVQNKNNQNTDPANLLDMLSSVLKQYAYYNSVNTSSQHILNFFLNPLRDKKSNEF